MYFITSFTRSTRLQRKLMLSLIYSFHFGWSFDGVSKIFRSNISAINNQQSTTNKHIYLECEYLSIIN